MNERNVKALREVLRRFYATDDEVRNLTLDITDLVAKHLAGSGVLMPSALTDEEADSVIRLCTCSEGDLSDVAYKGVAPSLERIAKGDAA